MSESDLATWERMMERQLGEKMGEMNAGLDNNAEAISNLNEKINSLNSKLDDYMKKAHTNRIIIIAILIVSILFGFMPRDQMATFMQFLARNTRMHLIDEYK